MAASSKQLFSTLIHKVNRNNVLLPLGTNFRSHMSVIHCSTSSESEENSKANVSRAMKAYLLKNMEYDKFLKEQLKEYNVGVKFLASMMGRKGPMSQNDVDEAIEYLFPSGLFVPKSRPVMKPPHEIFSKQKPVQFDVTGRPFHFLFYTGKPDFCQILHDAATKLESLNDHYDNMRKSELANKKLILVGEWISREDLEKKLLEKIFPIEYAKFVEVFNRLAEHPCAYMAEDFIQQFWIPASTQKDEEILEPVKEEDGTQTVITNLATRKTAVANVKLTYPGTGRIRINNLGLDYFINMQSREQVIAFPNWNQFR